MDPLSITTACVGLLGAVGGTSTKIVTFIRGCRDAQADLACVLEELSQLQLVIELLRDDDDINNNHVFPEPLRSRVSDLLSNCLAILGNIDTVLNKYTGTAGAAKWVMFGKDDIVVLRTSLETHRGALSLMLDLLSISLSKRIKEDTAVVRGTVGVIDQNTGQLMAELERIRVMVARTDELSASGHDYILEYLNSLGSYADTICND
ncbi:putative group protein, partial [Podospora aff. communis PSN243]